MEGFASIFAKVHEDGVAARLAEAPGPQASRAQAIATPRRAGERAIRDGFPVTPGHTLVITRRLVPDWFSATLEEQQAIFALVEFVKGPMTIAGNEKWLENTSASTAAGIRH